MPVTDYISKASSTNIYKYEDRATVNTGGISYTSTDTRSGRDEQIHASGVRVNQD